MRKDSIAVKAIVEKERKKSKGFTLPILSGHEFLTVRGVLYAARSRFSKPADPPVSLVARARTPQEAFTLNHL